jgi:hypothetical protein
MTAGNASKTPIDALWRQFDPERAEFFNSLFSDGPYGLLDYAKAHGYQPKAVYATKCHICTDLRQFFFDKTLFWSIISPDECYHP